MWEALGIVEDEFVDPFDQDLQDTIDELEGRTTTETVEKTYQELQALAKQTYAEEYEALRNIQGVSESVLSAYRAALANIEIDPDNLSYVVSFKVAARALKEENDRIKTLRLRAIGSIREQMIARGDRKAAKTWAKSVAIASSASRPYKVTRLREILEEFYLVTGGKANNLRSVVYRDFIFNGRVASKKERAYALRFAGEVNTGKYFTKSGYINQEELARAMYHEMGHHVEFGEDPTRMKYGQAAAAWRDARVSSMEQKRLSELTGISAYKDAETARPGDFYNAYLGKVYKDGSTEVVSMGLEHFSSAEDMLALYEKQPELFDFVLGITADD
jgi:hypothetical protein